jgi:hypothetical protein
MEKMCSVRIEKTVTDGSCFANYKNEIQTLKSGEKISCT